MSINKLGDFDDATYTLECDRCGNEAEETFSAFYDAVTWKKDKTNGWLSLKTKDGWIDICPKCKKPDKI